jgi:hypothetical protein
MAFHDAVIHGTNRKKLHNRNFGTKFSPMYQLKIKGGETKTIYCRLTNQFEERPFNLGFENIFTIRKQESNDFYQKILPGNISDDLKNIQRKALAGVLWSKQFYHFDVEHWLNNSDGLTPVNDGKLKGEE